MRLDGNGKQHRSHGRLLNACRIHSRIFSIDIYHIDFFNFFNLKSLKVFYTLIFIDGDIDHALMQGTRLISQQGLTNDGRP